MSIYFSKMSTPNLIRTSHWILIVGLESPIVEELTYYNTQVLNLNASLPLFVVVARLLSHVGLFAAPWTTGTPGLPSPRVHALNLWCHPTNSSLLPSLFFCLQSFPLFRSYLISFCDACTFQWASLAQLLSNLFPYISYFLAFISIFYI